MNYSIDPFVAYDLWQRSPPAEQAAYRRRFRDLRRVAKAHRPPLGSR